MVEISGNNFLFKDLCIKDSKRSSMRVPADNLISKRIRNNFPDRHNKLRDSISPHFFDDLFSNIYLIKNTTVYWIRRKPAILKMMELFYFSSSFEKLTNFFEICKICLKYKKDFILGF